MKREIMELLNEIGVAIAEKETSNAITVLNANGKVILSMFEEMKKDNHLNSGRLPHMYVDPCGDVRKGCPCCYEKTGRNQILYAGQKFCSVCGQRILYKNPKPELKKVFAEETSDHDTCWILKI